MTDDTKAPNWQTGTWEGCRRAQLRASLGLTVRQRLEALEALCETGRHFAQLRKQGAFHYGGKTMNEDVVVKQEIAESGSGYVTSASAVRHRVHLQGCTPTPLASYLKALAIHRLVAEQKDPEARGWWQGEHFVLESTLDEDGLKAFFLEEYRPTPIIAPWNGGSGFYFREEKIKDSKTGKNVKTGKRNQSTTATKVIDKLLISEAGRLHDLRECAEISKKIIGELSLEESPKEREKKNNLLNILRAQLPDIGLYALDASILISNEDLMFPPLLGTGGTDGNLDFTNNFIQRLFDLVDSQSGLPTPAAHDLLTNSLFGNVVVGLTSDAIGQFSPGQAGGPNAGTGYEAKPLINPWDFIFMIEGALLFAAAATRRLGKEERGTLAFPFTVRPKGGGQGGVSLADEAPARAEIWVPLWNKPASLMAVKVLFTEGRVTLGRRSVKDGLDFARSLSLLSAGRGIGSFQRYAFMMRSGKAYLATPLNRFRVPRSPQQDLISELDHWLWRVQAWARGDNASNRIKVLVQRLENALFDMAGGTGNRTAEVQKVLILLGEIQRYAGSSPATQEKLPPLPLLSERWFMEAMDNSMEFRIASALAGLQGTREHALPMRVHLSPLDPVQKPPAWLQEGARHHYRTWHQGGLGKNLVGVLEKRLLLAMQQGFSDKPLGGWPGADLASIGTFLAGETADKRIAQLVHGLAHCKMPRHVEWDSSEPGIIPAAFCLLKLVTTPDGQLRRCGLLAEHERLPVPPGFVRLLAVGRVGEAIRLAQRRLRIAGLCSLLGVPASTGLAGVRLAAALLIPLNDTDIRFLYRSVAANAGKRAS